jgi:hypothetical protein
VQKYEFRRSLFSGFAVEDAEPIDLGVFEQHALIFHSTWRPRTSVANEAQEWLEVKCQSAIGAIATVYKSAAATRLAK